MATDIYHCDVLSYQTWLLTTVSAMLCVYRHFMFSDHLVTFSIEKASNARQLGGGRVSDGQSHVWRLTRCVVQTRVSVGHLLSRS